MAYSFSPSTLALLNECPRCFWLHFKKGIRRPLGIFPSLPSGMDSVIKCHFDSFRARNMLPPELSSLRGVNLFQDLELLKKWRNNLRGVSWVDAEGNRFRGAVDELLEKGGKLIVLDFKTRGFPLKQGTELLYKDQLDIYNLLLRKNGYQTEDYAYLLFYHPLEVDEHGSVVFHTDLIRVEVSVSNAEKIFARALEVLQGEMPEPAEDCDYCRWAEKLANLDT